MLTAQEKTVFMHSIRNGLGFSKSCIMINSTPKDITEWIKNTEKGNIFYQKAITNVTDAYKHLLIVSNAYMKQKDFEKWKKNNEYIRQFQFKLNLWECYKKKEEVTSKEFLKAILIYKYDDEIATAIGFTQEEFADYVITNAYLHDMIQKIKR